MTSSIVNPMHILVIPTTYPSEHNQTRGIFFRDQARALKRAGFKVGVIAPILISLRHLPRGLFRFEQGKTKYDEEGIPTYRYLQWAWLSQVQKGNLFLWERAAERIFKEYIDSFGKPDIIHVHEANFAGVFASKIKREYGIPYILTEHSSSFERGLIKDWRLPFIKDAFRNASHRIFVSPQLGKTLETWLGNDVCPWTPIPNILDPLFSEEPLLRREIPGKPFRFLNIAFMREIKGQFDLLEAFSESFRGVEEFELQLGGDGPLRKELQRLTRVLGIEGKVRFLGMLEREQVLKEMQECDVFVLSSHYETFGVVLIEALACGKPVLATACGGPESIITSENGLLVPPGDIDCLASGLQKMYNSRERYDPQAIRRECLARYSEDVVVSQLSALYKDVVSGNRKGYT
jgi:glycosyltransferase involved in cell wall biosynthesis